MVASAFVHNPTELSLVVIVGVLVGAIIASMVRTRRKAAAEFETDRDEGGHST